MRIRVSVCARGAASVSGGGGVRPKGNEVVESVERYRVRASVDSVRLFAIIQPDRTPAPAQNRTHSDTTLTQTSPSADEAHTE